jgi:hypothetical protein
VSLRFQGGAGEVQTATGGEESIARIQLTQLQPASLPRKKCRQLIVVKDIERLVTRYALLKQSEAVGMDRAYE